MNLLHRWYCGSPGWRRLVEEQIIPWVLDGVSIGDHVLEIGPGPGLTTDVLRRMTPSLVGVEIHPGLAASLRKRMAGTNVTVVEGDATSMPFADTSFSTVLNFTMLHHVPSPKLQDRLLAEAFRVLRPGGWLAGTDSRTTLRWRLVHVFDTCVPVDPNTFAQRLQGAGFRDAAVDVNRWAFRFRARKPDGAQSNG